MSDTGCDKKMTYRTPAGYEYTVVYLLERDVLEGYVVLPADHPWVGHRVDYLFKQIGVIGGVDYAEDHFDYGEVPHRGWVIGFSLDPKRDITVGPPMDAGQLWEFMCRECRRVAEQAHLAHTDVNHAAAEIFPLEFTRLGGTAGIRMWVDVPGTIRTEIKNYPDHASFVLDREQARRMRQWLGDYLYQTGSDK